MPTPPFSQDRRDWLTEISSLFEKRKDKSKGLNSRIPKGCESVTTISTCNSRDDGASAKDQAMVDGSRRTG